jgi:hypothetical protein
VLPLYGFLEGDCLGLVILAEEDETVYALADKLRQAAKMRVASTGTAQVWLRGARVDPKLTLADAGFEPLERFDVTQVSE